MKMAPQTSALIGRSRLNSGMLRRFPRSAKSHALVCAWSALLSASACSPAVTEPPHVIDRQSSKTCPGDTYFADKPATLLVPSGVTVHLYPRREHPGVDPYTRPGSCEGPVRVLAPSGRYAWAVSVQASDMRVNFDVKTDFTPGELYELRITDSGGTVSWELVKPAAPQATL